MRVIRTIETSSAAPGVQIYDVRAAGATGFVYEGISEPCGLLSVLGADLSGAFTQSLLSMQRQNAGTNVAGSLWGVVYPGSRVELSFTNPAGGTAAWRLHLVTELLASFGTFVVREFSGSLAAAGTANLIGGGAAGQLCRGLRVALAGDRAFHVVSSQVPFSERVDVTRVSVVAAGGGSGDSGWFPSVGAFSADLVNDNGASPLVYAGYVVGSLEVV